jgi:putative secretion ATPase (PEP-CTERM system associated)
MYETYYGFTQPPFGLTPDVQFCYQHRSYSRAKAYMEYAVMRGEGFLVVTGRPGMGKTTLIQDLLAELGSQHRLVARVDSTQLDADDLLRLVTYAFGLPALGLDKASLLHSLGDFLRRRPVSAGTAILIVDEAQNLSDRSLEELRLITNLQEGARALIQIFLVGQESLRDVIRRHHLEQLQQRIVAACHLEPLDLIETRAYIRHRLLCAGWAGDPVFEAEALRLIYKVSSGVPRLINKVCDRLLLYGSVDETHSLRGEDAQVVISELQDEFLEHTNGEPLGEKPMATPEADAQEIEDLRGEPRTSNPFQGLFADDEAASPSQAGTVTPTSLGVPDMAGATAETRSAESPSLPFARDGLAQEAETGELRGLFGLDQGSQPASWSGADRFAERSDLDGAQRGVTPFGVVAPHTTKQADASLASLGDRNRRRPGLGFWAYASAAALLLGVGGLLIVQQGKSPDELVAQVSQLGDRAVDSFKSLADRPSAHLDSTGSDQGGEVPTHPAPTPPLAGAGEKDPIDIPGRTHGGSEVAGSGDRPSENAASDTIRTPAEPAPNEKDPAAVVKRAPEAIGNSGTIGSAAPEVGTERQVRVASARESAPTATEGAALGGAVSGLPADLGSSSESPGVRTPSGSGDGEGSADPALPAETRTTSPTPSEGGSTEAGGRGTPSRSLVSELQDLGLPIRDLGDGRLAFDLADEVPFASESARLPNRAERVLEPLAAAFLRNPEVRITLVGHTDDRGPADYNRRLSVSRARAVADYLNRQGVPEARLFSQGMGKDAPVPEEDGTTRARQRRVEVIIEPIAR